MSWLFLKYCADCRHTSLEVTKEVQNLLQMTFLLDGFEVDISYNIQFFQWISNKSIEEHRIFDICLCIYKSRLCFKQGVIPTQGKVASPPPEPCEWTHSCRILASHWSNAGNLRLWLANADATELRWWTHTCRDPLILGMSARGWQQGGGGGHSDCYNICYNAPQATNTEQPSGGEMVK